MLVVTMGWVLFRSNTFAGAADFFRVIRRAIPAMQAQSWSRYAAARSSGLLASALRSAAIVEQPQAAATVCSGTPLPARALVSGWARRLNLPGARSGF